MLLSDDLILPKMESFNYNNHGIDFKKKTLYARMRQVVRCPYVPINRFGCLGDYCNTKEFLFSQQQFFLLCCLIRLFLRQLFFECFPLDEVEFPPCRNLPAE